MPNFLEDGLPLDVNPPLDTEEKKSILMDEEQSRPSKAYSEAPRISKGSKKEKAQHQGLGCLWFLRGRKLSKLLELLIRPSELRKMLRS